MELVKRYIAAVQRELPASESEEIGRELEANIMDKLDTIAEQRQLTHPDTVLVLQQMGRPREVAAQFVAPQPLISTGYLPLYKYTLFMVIGILFVLQVVSTTVAWLHVGFGLLLYLKSILSGLIEDGAFAFTVITLGFMVMSRSKERSCQQVVDWTPESLPPVGPHWRHISLQDIFTDLTTYTVLLIIIWYPLSFNEAQASLFTPSALGFLTWFSPVIMAGVVLSVWQLRVRRWNQIMQIANIAINILFMMAFTYLALTGPLLQLGTDLTRTLTSLGHQFTTWGLLILACVPAYEAVRDIRRLRRSRAERTPVIE